MIFDNEEFKLNWDELRFLIDRSIFAIRLELGQVGSNLEHIDQYPNLKIVYDQIEEIKNKFNYDEKLREWNDELERIKRDNSKGKEEERKIKAINKLKEISKKYPRLLTNEIEVLVKEQPRYFMAILRELEEKGELKFQYIKSTGAILFE